MKDKKGGEKTTKKTRKQKLAGVVALKQKIVIEKLRENMGKDGKKGTMKEAMTDAGYSESYAENGDIKKTKTWNDLMEQYFSDEKIAAAEEKQMNAARLYDYQFSKKISDKQIREDVEAHTGCRLVRIVEGTVFKTAYFYAPDNTAIGKSLDRIYKLKKKYDNTIKLKKGLSELSDEEIDDFIAGEISEALGFLPGEDEEEGA